MPKISIIGAGFVGAQAAFCAAIKQLGDIVLIDVVEGVAKGKALDIQQSLPLFSSSASIVGGSDYALTKDSDIVMITAGIPRKPGMTREQLLETNASIVKSVTEQVVKHSPNCVLLVMTNPLDAMCYVAFKVSKFPRNRVIGQAGVLDASRFRSFIAKELNCSVNDIDALVLGSHGEEMVPVPSKTTVKGSALSSVLSKEKIDALALRTRNAGAEIVNLMSSSAFFAPGASIVEMADAILNWPRAMPCSVFLQGEYGVKDCFIGVPVMLGRNGVENVVDVYLAPEEKAAFMKAYEHIAALQRSVDAFLKK